MKRRLVVAAMALAPCALVVACQWVFPTLLEGSRADASVGHDVGPVVVDAPGDRGSQRDTATPPPPSATGCAGAQPPPPPTQDTSPTSVPPFVIAIRTLSLENPEAGPPLGFNLDDDCTCEDAGPPSCVSSVRHCDAPGGRDQSGNAIATLASGFAFGGDATGYVNSLIAQGNYTVLIGVRDYNGGADDTQITLSVFVSSGTRSPDGGTIPPKWDGTDRWNVDPVSFASYTEGDGGYEYVPLGTTESAYVAGGVLVAQVTRATFDLGLGSFILSTAIMTGQLVPYAGSFRIDDGQIGGRLPLSGVFALLATIKDPFATGNNLCANDPTFVESLPAICGAADIMGDPLDDNRGLACDAISLAVGFTGYPAGFAGPYQGFRNDAPCDGSIAMCESD